MNTTTLLETSRMLPPQSADLLLTDERLMEMIQNHVREGIDLLHGRYAPLLKQISGAVLHNDGDVQDLVQEVFVEIWNRAASYEPAKGRPLGWIVTLTRRRAIDRLRRRDAYGRAGERFAEETSRNGDGWTHVHEDLARHEMTEHLLRALAVLPEAQRHAIQLAYHRQMSQREIAAHTGIPLGTVKTRLELGLKKMAVFLGGFEDLLVTDKLLAPCKI
jgi:RNA polymerase sigma-70 factor (ECF subfamily)